MTESHSQATPHRPAGRLALAAAACFLGACSTLKDVPVNPKPLHADATQAYPARAAAGAALNPYAIPVERYIRALADAERVDDPRPAQLRTYADTGIALVQLQCLRWFSLLGERQHEKDFQDSNYNVIRQLGTALLGIGKASSALVATYGAGNTAYEGLANNFEASFLGAPNGKKVKQQVMRLLDEQEEKVYEAAAGERATLLTVYRKLERYADICTHSTAREIVGSALDQATATINSQGMLEIQPSVNAQKIAEVRATSESEARSRDVERKALLARVNNAEKARETAAAAADARAAEAAQQARLAEARAAQAAERASAAEALAAELARTVERLQAERVRPASPPAAASGPTR